MKIHRLFSTLISLAAFGSPAPAQSAEPLTLTVPDIQDFLIQDVCARIDDDRPTADDPYACPPGTLRRDLRLGEFLPYHKHDQPDCLNPRGFQVSDSFPAPGLDGKLLFVKTFDLKSFEDKPAGGAFREFNAGDGYDIHVDSGRQINIAATRDPSAATPDPLAGIQYFVAPAGEACDVYDSWTLFPSSWPFSDAYALTRLNISGSRRQCPSFYNVSYTEWRVADVSYADGHFAAGDCSQGTPPVKALRSIIVTHWGGGDPHPPTHKEVFYFTREYGGTRWERWEERDGRYQMVDVRSWTFIRPSPVGGYNPRLWHLPPELGVSNLLKNGDWGAGPSLTSAWQLRDGQESRTRAVVHEEAAGEFFQNHYVELACAGSCLGNSLHQTVAATRLTPSSSGSLSFGASVWAEKATTADLALYQLQIAADGRETILASERHALNVAAQRHQAVLFHGRGLVPGATHVRWELYPTSQGQLRYFIDDAFLSTW